MFHAVIILIATCFGCTLYYFYAFSGTNLLTRYLVPVFCYFWFQKSYRGNILGIARDKNPGSYFPIMYTESKGKTEGSPEAPTPAGDAGPPLARQHMVWGP